MPAGTLAADLTGRTLGLAFGAISRIRPTDKPLHPRGAIARGTLTRTGAVEPCGVDWLDRAGTEDVLVRVSRSAGLPAPLPDVFGLAVRVHLADGSLGDLLFSSTGAGTVTRYLIRPARHVSAGLLGTLMPYRTPAGARWLAARVRAEDDGGRMTATLHLADARGPWQSFASITSEPLQPDAAGDTAFDPFLNAVPGLQPYDWICRLRERSYAAARHSRHAGVPRG